MLQQTLQEPVGDVRTRMRLVRNVVEYAWYRTDHLHSNADWFVHLVGALGLLWRGRRVYAIGAAKNLVIVVGAVAPVIAVGVAIIIATIIAFAVAMVAAAVVRLINCRRETFEICINDERYTLLELDVLKCEFRSFLR